MSFFDIKLDWLEHLQALHETGSVNRAAARSDMTAPALRHNLKQLEAYCGESLLIAGPQGLHLNKRGLELLSHSQTLLTQFDVLHQGFEQSAPRLVLGLANAHPTCGLPDVLSELYANFPGMVIQTRCGTTQEITRQVLGAQADLGMVSSLEINDERLIGTPGPVSKGIYVKSSKHHVPEVYLLPLLWKYSATEPVSYPELTAERVHYIGGVQHLIRLCLAGVGIGFVPRWHVQDELDTCQLIPATGPELPTQGPYQSRLTLIHRANQKLSAPAARLCEWWKSTYTI